MKKYIALLFLVTISEQFAQEIRQLNVGGNITVRMVDNSDQSINDDNMLIEYKSASLPKKDFIVSKQAAFASNVLKNFYENSNETNIIEAYNINSAWFERYFIPYIPLLREEYSDNSALEQQLINQINNLSDQDLKRLIKFADYLDINVLYKNARNSIVEKLKTYSAQPNKYDSFMGLPDTVEYPIIKEFLSPIATWHNRQTRDMATSGNMSGFSQSLQWLSDDSLYLSGARNGTVWHLSSNQIQPVYPTYGDQNLLNPTLSSNAQFQAIIDGNTIEIFDINNTLTQTLQGHTAQVNLFSFSPNSQLIASASEDKTIKIWDLEDGSLVRTLPSNTSDINALAWSPNGQLLAVALSNHTIEIWDLANGSLVQTLQGHATPVNAVAFSPNGTLLASASDDKIVKIWTVAENFSEALYYLDIPHAMLLYHAIIQPNSQLTINRQTEPEFAQLYDSFDEKIKTIVDRYIYCP